MADTPISGLPAAHLPLSGTEDVPVVQDGVTRRAPASSFSGDVGDRFYPYVTVGDISRALSVDDVGVVLQFIAESEKTVSAPGADLADVPENAEIGIENYGSGSLTISSPSGVSITPPRGGTLVMMQGDFAVLKRRGSTNTWIMVGGSSSL